MTVMETARNDDYVVSLYGINQSMFVVDTSGPISRKISLERFGFADTLEGCPKNFLDQLVGSL